MEVHFYENIDEDPIISITVNYSKYSYVENQIKKLTNQQFCAIIEEIVKLTSKQFHSFRYCGEAESKPKKVPK